MKAADEATHYLKDKVGLKEADRIVASVQSEALLDAADWLTRKYGVTNRAASDLRRMANTAQSTP